MIAIRYMGLEDVPQVSEIEREAFPPPWPPTNFRRELTSDGLTHYIVAYEPISDEEPREGKAPDSNGARGLQHGRLKSGLARFFRFGTPDGATKEVVLGFAGVWFAADEAHLSTIAVRETDRGRGIGELLLAAVINLGLEHGARLVSLEVRISNRAAQSLYKKYGFEDGTIRRGYYTDNKEDALIMTALDIDSKPYRQLLTKLAEALSRKLGQDIGNRELTVKGER